MSKHTESDPTQLARELLATIRANDAADALLLAEQIELEAAGVQAEEDTPPAAQVDAAARTWMNGAAPPPVAPMGNRLYQILVSRAGIHIADDELQRQLFQAGAAVFRDWSAKNTPRWHKIQQRRAKALLDLRSANREAAEYRCEAAAICPGNPSLECDRISGVFAWPPITDSTTGFLESCMRAGIIKHEALNQ
jgi:hypothetical protein